MHFVLLTLSTTGEKTLVHVEDIVFATSEYEPQNEKNKFTRIYFNKVQLPEKEIACLDVKETVEEIYKKIK